MVTGVTPQAAGAAAQHGSGAAAAAKITGFLENFRVFPQERFRETSSGLKIAVLQEGSGSALQQGMKVSVKYTGWLSNGTKFDSSLDQGKPFEFVLGNGRVISGWEEGLAGMKPGERRQLIIPAKLAYGDREVGKIPPGSTLIFNVEAVAVTGGAGKVAVA